MAEIPKIESGRVGLSAPRAAVAPNVVYPQLTPEIALLQQAKYQGTLADKLDRMSSILYRDASELSSKAGLQFAAENPLTQEQLQAMVKGDMSGVALGSPLNVFDSALRKVRAFELSAHAEGEATGKLLEIYNKAERGELDFEGVQNQVKAMTDGYGRSLAEVDPESSFKYRASMATMGNRVIDETAKLETKKRVMSNSIKTERMYQDFKKMSEMIYSGDSPAPDPTTGQPISKDDLVDSLAQNFINNSIAMVGINGSAVYQQQIIKDLTDSKVNALAKYIADDFGQNPEAFMKLRSGDAGRMTDIYQTLGEDGRSKVMATLFTKVGTQNNAKKEMDEENKTGRELEAIDLYKKLETASGAQKKAIIKRLADLRVVSFEELKKLSTGGGESSPMAMFNAIDGIYSGAITTSDQIKSLPIKPGDKIKLLEKLHSSDRSDDRDLDAGLRRLAGVPLGMQFSDPKGAEFKRKAQLDRDAERVRQQLILDGKPSNSRAVLDVLSKETEAKKNTEGAKAAKNSLKPYEERAGGEITSETFEAFTLKVKSGKVKNVTEKDLLRIKRLVDQAEGNE